MEYAILTKEEQRKLFLNAKTHLQVTWNELAKLLKIHRSTLFFNLRGESRIPIHRYLFLNKYASTHLPMPRTARIDNKPKNPRMPEKISELLAECLGILAGDGHMTLVKYLIDVCADKDLDNDFITRHVPKAFKKLFGVAPRIYTVENRTHCRIYCKKLVLHLHKRFQVPLGNKMGQLHIQKEVMRDKKLLIAYLRGLFDTDGSIYQHRPNDAMLEYSSGDPVFLSEIAYALRILGFSASTSRKSVYLYSKNDLKRFFSIIRPSNQKHISKYRAFLTTGHVPRTTELLKGSVRFIKGQPAEMPDAPVV